jgi:hypothetical protein
MRHPATRRNAGLAMVCFISPSTKFPEPGIAPMPATY